MSLLFWGLLSFFLNAMVLVLVGCPVGHRDGAPSQVLEWDHLIIVLVSQSAHLDTPSVKTRWDGTAFRYMKELRQPYPMGFKTLLDAIYRIITI